MEWSIFPHLAIKNSDTLKRMPLIDLRGFRQLKR